MLKVVLIACSLVGLTFSPAPETPGLAGYQDILRRFYIFDNGNTRQIDHLPIQNLKVGGNCLAYNDNTGNFKVYHEGEVVKLQDGFVTEENYAATDNLLVYHMDRQLKVFDRGKTTTLSGSFAQENVNELGYAFGDSIVAWFDQFAGSFRVYYEGEIVTVVQGPIQREITNFKASDNLVAYVDHLGYFRVFDHGEDYEIYQAAQGIQYEVGRNIVVFWNPTYNQFNVLYYGEEFELDQYAPESFQAGINQVAYVDNVGEFKAFIDGDIYMVSSFEPDWYKVIDDMILYSEQDAFKVFYKGQSHYIENFMPDSWQAQNGCIAYLDQQGLLKAFLHGEQVAITAEIVQSYLLSRNTIHYLLGNNANKVYWKGKSY